MEDYNPTESPPGDLPAQWRQRAQFLADYGDPHCARLWALAATELEQALRVLGEASLSLVQAAGRVVTAAIIWAPLFATAKIPNVGRRNAPRIRRTDLPVKSSSSPGRPRKAHGDIDVRSIINKKTHSRR